MPRGPMGHGGPVSYTHLDVYKRQKIVRKEEKEEIDMCESIDNFRKKAVQELSLIHI